MVGFVLGCCLYLLCAFCMFYWVFIEDAEDYFFQSLFCVTVMSLLSLMTISFKNEILSINAVNWVSTIAASVAVIFSIIYILGFIFGSINDFEVRLLLFLIPDLLSGATVALAFFWNYDIKNYWELILAAIGVLCVATAVYSEINHKKNEKINYERQRMLERELRYRELAMDSMSRNQYSKQELANIERVLAELYMRIQDGKISQSKVWSLLRDTDIPFDLRHRIMERLVIDDYISRATFLNLADFLQELLPEIFSTRRDYHSSSMDIRFYEDMYEKLRYSINSENKRVMAELIKRIDSMNSDIKKNLQSEIRKPISSETLGMQNQIRELFHALETPIATSEMALATLKASFDSMTEQQIKKFDRIQNTIKLIKSILFAYRELTFMNIYSDENTFFSLPEIINSIPSLMSAEAKNVPLEQRNVPDQISKYSTNLIVVLLLPLVHNAIEASPENKPVLVECNQGEKNCTLRVVNFCKHVPRQVNLDTEGYSSKGNEHVGTGISIVRRISKSAGVDFELKVDDNKVSATLSFPKQ